jgi:alkaline phosphatase
MGWRDGADRLALDDIRVGSARTHPADEFITDSAASGTALACGVKTRNDALAVDTAGRPVATVLEAAESLGMATGLVATSTITHATPASFSAHVLNRAHQDSVALQQLQQGIEVLLGGGADFFLPVSQGGLRMDERDLIEEARQSGYAVARSRTALLQITETPVLGLFSGSHMDFEIDRDEQTQPGLAEMTRHAIELLSKDPDGFFLMVEGSKIDHAAHVNDIPAHLHDILAYDDAVAAALEFARADGQTLIISTSDHETGGLTIGTRVNQISAYTWYPERLSKAKHSLAYAADSLFGRVDGRSLLELLGIDDPTDEELEVAGDTTWSWQAMADMMSRRARIGWTTGGHTAVDVPVFAFGPGSRRFAGNLDNTEIGQRLAELMPVDLGQLTREVRKKRPDPVTQPAGD